MPPNPEDKLFEQALAEFYSDPDRYECIGHRLGWEPAACKARFDHLESDILDIFSGIWPMPEYPEDALERERAAAASAGPGPSSERRGHQEQGRKPAAIPDLSLPPARKVAQPTQQRKQQQPPPEIRRAFRPGDLHVDVDFGVPGIDLDADEGGDDIDVDVDGLFQEWAELDDNLVDNGPLGQAAVPAEGPNKGPQVGALAADLRLLGPHPLNTTRVILCGCSPLPPRRPSQQQPRTRRWASSQRQRPPRRPTAA